MTKLSLWQKEWMEAVRTYKLLFIPVIFVLLGVAQPISVHFMPQILERASLPEGTVIQIPTPPPPEIVGSIIDQYNQLCVFILILAVMGSIAREIEQGQTAFLSSLRISPVKYLLTKWVTLGFIAVLATLAGFLATSYYTTLLFGSLNWAHIFGAALLYCLYPLFVVSATLMFSTLFTSQLAVAGCALATLIVSGTLSLFGRDLVKWLPIQVSGAAKLLLSGAGVSVTRGIIVSAVWIGLTLLIAYFVLRRREL